MYETVLQNLKQHNFGAYYADGIPALKELISALIPAGSVVSSGDSVTLEETGVFDLLRSGGFVFLDKHQPGLSHEEKREIYLKSFRADTFVTGVNAVTEDGKLFNIDGNGSRVAPMLYGPAQVIAVAGTNKLVRNEEEAVRRVRQTAAPLDAKRLGKNTPCTKLGRCVDCRHPERICNDFVLITGQFQKERIKVILVEGTYGY